MYVYELWYKPSFVYIFHFKCKSNFKFERNLFGSLYSGILICSVRLDNDYTDIRHCMLSQDKYKYFFLEKDNASYLARAIRFFSQLVHVDFCVECELLKRD